VAAIRFAVQVLEQWHANNPNSTDLDTLKPDHDEYMKQNGVLAFETRAWPPIRENFSNAVIKKKNTPRYYTLNDDGQVCFKGKLVIGWEDYHGTIVKVIRSIEEPDRNKERIEKRVKECYHIPPKAIKAFFDMCVVCNLFGSDVGGGATNNNIINNNGGGINITATTANNNNNNPLAAFRGGTNLAVNMHITLHTHGNAASNHGAGLL
jgi:hypothetical protein